MRSIYVLLFLFGGLPLGAVSHKELVHALLCCEADRVEKYLLNKVVKKKKITKMNNYQLANNRGLKANLLMAAAYAGNLDVVKAFIKQHPDLDRKNDFGNTALMFAAMRGNYEIMNCLMDAGATIPLVSSPQFITGVYKGRTARDYYSYRCKAFVQAILSGDASRVEFYKPTHAEIKANKLNRRYRFRGFNKELGLQKDERVSALFAIVGRNVKSKQDRIYYCDLLGALASAGANLSVRTSNKRTLLMVAALAGNGLMVKVLKEIYNCRVDRRDFFNQTFEDYYAQKEKILEKTAHGYTPERLRKKKEAFKSKKIHVLDS